MQLAQGQQLSQRQSQKLSLTQGMRQSILMLQSDAIDLSEYLKDISLENPLFDVHTSLDVPFMQGTRDNQSYQLRDNDQSLFEYLLDQVQLTMRKTPLRDLVIYLVEQLDPNGYLPLTDKEILKELDVDKIMLLDAKTLLQQLDPPGVGAHDLRECLFLQAQADSEAPEYAEEILDKYFDLVAAHDWKKLMKKLEIDQVTLDDNIDYIKSLSGAPGERYNGSDLQYVVPELQVKNNGGKLSLAVTRYGQPQLIFAEETYDLLSKTVDEDVKKYIKQKYDQYQTLEYNLERRIKTISMIGKVVVNKQYKFFTQESDSLEPLLLRDVAQKLQLSESTVSRAINGKYIQTDFGLFALKHFFSRRSKVAAGVESRSVDQVKQQIKSLIDNEDKPLSDQKISDLLKKQGSEVARRTVAKYREQLEIPTASKRKNDQIV